MDSGVEESPRNTSARHVKSSLVKGNSRHYPHERPTTQDQADLHGQLQNMWQERYTNSVALVRERTIPTERPQPVGEGSANFCG